MIVHVCVSARPFMYRAAPAELFGRVILRAINIAAVGVYSQSLAVTTGSCFCASSSLDDTCIQNANSIRVVEAFALLRLERTSC